MGYLRTYDVTIDRPVNGQAKLFGNTNSFIASHHLQLTISPAALAYVAQGVAAGANPNNRWNYISNMSAL